MASAYGSGVVLVIGDTPFGTQYQLLEAVEVLVAVEVPDSFERAAAEHDFWFKLGPSLPESPAVDERPKPAPMWKAREYRRGKRDK